MQKKYYSNKNINNQCYLFYGTNIIDTYTYIVMQISKSIMSLKI